MRARADRQGPAAHKHTTQPAGRGCSTTYRASARSRSSCSKALAILLISVARAPTFCATSRHVAVAAATDNAIWYTCVQVAVQAQIRCKRFFVQKCSVNVNAP
jgi:hypothetical protein